MEPDAAKEFEIQFAMAIIYKLIDVASVRLQHCTTNALLPPIHTFQDQAPDLHDSSPPLSETLSLNTSHRTGCIFRGDFHGGSYLQNPLSIAKLDANVANTLTAERDFGGVCCPWDEKAIHANHLSVLSGDMILSLDRFMLSKWIRDKL